MSMVRHDSQHTPICRLTVLAWSKEHRPPKAVNPIRLPGHERQQPMALKAPRKPSGGGRDLLLKAPISDRSKSMGELRPRLTALMLWLPRCTYGYTKACLLRKVDKAE